MSGGPGDDRSGARLRFAAVTGRPRLILLLACLGNFMVVLDVAVVNVALPAIQADLGFSQVGLQWIVNAYTLTYAGFLLLGGRTADLFGRRRMFLLALGLFTVASLVCGLAPTAATLIAARAVQGLGAAILAPVTLTIVTITFTQPRERAYALGWWGASLASGGAAGVLIGGILTDLLSWRWIFLINLPVGILGILAARALLTESRAESRSRSLDVPGALTITLGLTSLVYGVVNSEVHGWTSPWTWVPLAAAGVLVASFAYVELRVARAPIAPLRIFRSRALTAANVAMFCVGGSMFAMWYFVSLYLQVVLGQSPLIAGLCFIPAALAIIVASQVAGRLVARVGPRPLLVTAGVMISAALFWMSRMSADGSYLTDILGPILLVSLGLGLSFPPGTWAATAGVAPTEAGLASGLINSNRQIGGAVGLAVLATIAATHTSTLSASEGPQAALAGGYGLALVVAGVVALGVVAAALMIPGQRPTANPVTTVPATGTAD